MSSQIEVQWILLFSRVVLAVVMIHYGWPKVRDLKSNANDFANMGFRPGMFWGTLIALFTLSAARPVEPNLLSGLVWPELSAVASSS